MSLRFRIPLATMEAGTDHVVTPAAAIPDAVDHAEVRVPVRVDRPTVSGQKPEKSRLQTRSLKAAIEPLVLKPIVERAAAVICMTDQERRIQNVATDFVGLAQRIRARERERERETGEVHCRAAVLQVDLSRLVTIRVVPVAASSGTIFLTEQTQALALSEEPTSHR